MAFSARLSPFIVATALLATPAYADLLSLSLGKSLWQGALTGESQSQADRARKLKPVDFNKLALTQEEYPGYWLQLEHPLPLLPNVRVAYTQINSFRRVRDVSSISSGDGLSISTPQNIDTAMAFNTLDATFYYEVLDHWVNLDAGLSLRKLDGYLDVFYELGEQYPRNFPHSYTEMNEIIPMLYSQAQLDIPGTGVFLQTRLNAISSGGDRFIDAEANIGYQWSGVPGLDIGLLLGYRKAQLALKKTGNLYADAQIDGVQGSFFVHF